jgi:hypothetical protein
MIGNQVLPDGHGIPAATQSQFDQLAIWFAGTGGRLRMSRGSLPSRIDPPESVVTSMAGFAGSGSVVTCMAGFADARRSHPGWRTPAVFRYALTVSLRTPVASSMRRKDHPSFPSAMACCFFSSLKTLLMSTEPTSARVAVNVPGSTVAGFAVTLYGRFWVTPEGQNRSCSFKRAAKQEKIQPLEWYFFLTSPFGELIGSWERRSPPPGRLIETG